MSVESMDTSKKTHGGCEGPYAMYLRQSDFINGLNIVKRDYTLASETIKRDMHESMAR